jgi:hypothetical protein
MSMQGQLIRCPNCIHALGGNQPGSGELILDPERNVCPLCHHVFSAAQAKIEDYVGHGSYGKNVRRSPGTEHRAPSAEPPPSRQEALFK